MILVIGVGNPGRGDDAAGLLVARRVRESAGLRDVQVTELTGDQFGLLDAWAGADDVYVVDAVRSGGPAGTVYRFGDARSLAGEFARRGTHEFSLADVVSLAGALGRLPARLVGYGIEGAVFEPGAPLSPAVGAAIDVVANMLGGELARPGAGGPGAGG